MDTPRRVCIDVLAGWIDSTFSSLDSPPSGEHLTAHIDAAAIDGGIHYTCEDRDGVYIMPRGAV